MRTLTRMAAVALVALWLGSAGRAGAEAPINLNTATAAQLEGLKGIGPSKAKAIVEQREKNGQFHSVDDLKLVRGIGDKMLEQLRPQLTVDGSAPAAAPAAAASSSKKP